MEKFKAGNIAVSIVMFIVCVTLMCVMFMQFKTVEETDITEIENMRDRMNDLIIIEQVEV